MINQHCSNCSAPMTMINNSDGTNSLVCKYCGAIVKLVPQNNSERLFSLANRALNSFANRKKAGFFSVTYRDDNNKD